MKSTVTNGVPEPEVWDSLRKDARKLATNNNAAAAVKAALEENGGYNARVLGFKLGLREQVNHEHY